MRRSEAAALTWGDVQRWDDGSGRITVIRSKTDVEAAGRRGCHHARRHEGSGRHQAGVGREQRVFGPSQVAHRVKADRKVGRCTRGESAEAVLRYLWQHTAVRFVRHRSRYFLSDIILGQSAPINLGDQYYNGRSSLTKPTLTTDVTHREPKHRDRTACPAGSVARRIPVSPPCSFFAGNPRLGLTPLPNSGFGAWLLLARTRLPERSKTARY